MSSTRTGLLLAEDLLFVSRITGTARDLGLALHNCRTPADLLARADKENPVCVLIDLHHPGLVIEELVGALKETGQPLLVGYGSHVDTATLKQARSAGCDLVLPRSKFAAELPHLLPVWFAEEAGG